MLVVVSGMLIGVLQLPLVFALKDTLGSSSSYCTVVSQWVVTKRLQELFPYLASKRCGLDNWWQVGSYLYPSFEKAGGILVYICPSFRPSFRNTVTLLRQ